MFYPILVINMFLLLLFYCLCFCLHQLVLELTKWLVKRPEWKEKEVEQGSLANT